MAYVHGYSPRGQKPHRLYSTWAGMIQRCTNPKNVSWKWYGAKGIKVCERWRTFENFLQDMKEGWSPELTLERLDNSKGYFKENCVWETTHRQRMNDAHGKLYELNGVKKRLSAWADDLGITYEALYRRIYLLGWKLERALTVKRIGYKSRQCIASKQNVELAGLVRP